MGAHRQCRGSRRLLFGVDNVSKLLYQRGQLLSLQCLYLASQSRSCNMQVETCPCSTLLRKLACCCWEHNWCLKATAAYLARCQERAQLLPVLQPPYVLLRLSALGSGYPVSQHAINQ